MPDIKVKDLAKGTIKTIDKAATTAERMKNAYIRTKDTAGHSMDSGENSPQEYAADRVSDKIDSAAHEAVREFDRQGRQGVKTTKENITTAKDFFSKPRSRPAQKTSAAQGGGEYPEYSGKHLQIHQNGGSGRQNH